MGNKWIGLDMVFFFPTEALAEYGKEGGELDYAQTSYFWIPWKGRGF